TQLKLQMPKLTRQALGILAKFLGAVIREWGRHQRVEGLSQKLLASAFFKIFQSLAEGLELLGESEIAFELDGLRLVLRSPRNLSSLQPTSRADQQHESEAYAPDNPRSKFAGRPIHSPLIVTKNLQLEVMSS